MALEDSFPSRLVCKGCTELRPLFFAEDSYKHHAPRPLRLSLFFTLFPCVVCRCECRSCPQDICFLSACRRERTQHFKFRFTTS